MMLENRVTGLFLLSDLSVGCTTDLIQDSAPFALFFSVSKANLDRCAFAKEGTGLGPNLVPIQTASPRGRGSVGKTSRTGFEPVLQP